MVSSPPAGGVNLPNGSWTGAVGQLIRNVRPALLMVVGVVVLVLVVLVVVLPLSCCSRCC